MLSDELYMTRCIELARLGKRRVAPNPMVGAVIVHEDRVIGEGYHAFYGGPHAEVNAVNSVSDQSLLGEATIYVSLEPCAHFGKTPPCADLLIRCGFKRVVIGCRDPFDAVNGKGIERLKMAGIEVSTGVLESECLALNKRFFTFHRRKRPYVILKWAQTTDGYIDAPRAAGEQGIRRISAPETQVLVHNWRSEEAAILVGKRTVLNDNPSLTVRAVSGLNPTRIVLDSRLELSLTDYVVFDGSAPTLLLNTIRDESLDGVTLVRTETNAISEILKTLYEREIQSVLVEGGKAVLEQFLSSGLYDEIRIIRGPGYFGDGLKAPDLLGLPDHSEHFLEDEIFYYRKA